MEFLKENQGPINKIGLMKGSVWTLDIRSDGSAAVGYRKGVSKENGEAPAGTFAFPELVEKLLTAAETSQGDYQQDATAFFQRQGQVGAVKGKQLADRGLVASPFRLAIENVTDANKTLGRRFESEWLRN